MAKLKVVNSGEKIFLDTITDNVPLTYKLFDNDIVPEEDHTNQFYLQPDFDGYEPVVAANWTPAELGLNGKAWSTADPIQFQAGAIAQQYTIYGYFVTDGAGTLVLAQRAPAPIVINNPGDTITVIPLLTLSTEP